MVVQSVWLIHHKASLSEESPMNLDGSSFMTGVGVVPAPSMKEALSLFDEYLSKNKMSIIDSWKCEQWDPKNYDSNLLEGRQINNAAAKSLETNLIHYTCGVSSEALDCEEDNDD